MRKPKPIVSSIGQLLALCREMKGETLREVAHRTGVSNGFLCQIENGSAMPGLLVAVILCDHYGIKIERLATILREHGAGGAE